MTEFEAHKLMWCDCMRCPLGAQRTAKSKVVLGKGSLPADVLFIGEAAGESEDMIGIPFVGPAGQLLDRITERAFRAFPDLTRAYTNLVGCFPRQEKKEGRHAPPEESIRACAPRLDEFVRMAQPKLIVFVGRLSRTWYSKLIKYDGEFLPVRYIEIVHPSFILSRMDLAQRPLAIQTSIVDIATALGEI